MKYRKRPVIIDAFQWTGDETQEEDPDWIVEAIKSGEVCFIDEGLPNVAMLIHTLEGIHRAGRGDYIIKGIKGELYPCKSSIFELTYELV